MPGFIWLQDGWGANHMQRLGHADWWLSCIGQALDWPFDAVEWVEGHTARLLHIHTDRECTHNTRWQIQ